MVDMASNQEIPYLQSGTLDKIKKAKLLVVGAGGIGCELLKNLVLCGFKNIDVFDLDTIEVSNLNRQFLFQKQHVGKYKAEVAKESILRFAKDLNITVHTRSIISNEFNLNFFKKFDIVLSALDNVEARTHVNRLCLYSDIPLIESGTSGYNGQTEYIKKNTTACYECFERPREKTFAICTIRNTPSLMIHCIVWSKFLFNQLFGEVDELQEDVSLDLTDPSLKNSNGAKEALPAKPTREWAQEVNYDSDALFNKFFKDDINNLLQMDDLWKDRDRVKPTPLDINNLDDTAPESTSSLKSFQVLSLKECYNTYTKSLESLKQAKEKLAPGSFLVWDKDDDNAMNFIFACSNIRAHIFGIEKLSLFDIKSMAGNIVPAIATSNAIIGALSCLTAIKLIQGVGDCFNTYTRQNPVTTGGLIVPEKVLMKPNPKCRICSSGISMVSVVCDFDKMTLKEFESAVLKNRLAMPYPDVSKSDGTVIISSDEDENLGIQDKTLRDLNVQSEEILFADDFIQTYKVKIMIMHQSAEDLDGMGFFIEGDEMINQEEKATEKENGKEVKPGPSKEMEVDDDLEIMDDVEEDITNGSPLKRKLSVEPTVPVKKRKTETIDIN